MFTVGDEQWGRQSVSLQGELEDGGPPQMVHVPICLTVRARLWDGFLLRTRRCDGEPEALRCWWDSRWEEWTRRSFEPFRRSIFKTYKIILIVVASTLLAAGLRCPSPSCLDLEVCLCYFCVVVLHSESVKAVNEEERIFSQWSHTPRICCELLWSWRPAGPRFPVQTSVPQVIKTSNESKRHKRNYHFGELSIIVIA